MARKKVEPITSLGNEDKLTVQKSLPLFALWRSPLTLAEFKILDTYLSRIDSHKPDKRSIVFEKGELERLLGVKRIRTEELDERLKNLGTPIRIDDSTAKNKRFTRISLFEKAVAEQDEFGLWQVELTASQSAMKYFFNIENLGYLRYKLRCITSLTSRYTYIMFIYLEANRFRKSWEVPLDELKQILDCDKEETYKQFKRFNDLILKKVQREIFEKTECRYFYEPIKQGRKVTKIKFTVETLSDVASSEDEQLSLFSTDASKTDIDYGSELAELLGSSACNDEFTVEQIRVLQDLVLKAIPSSDYIELCDYVSHKVHKMNLYDSRTKIKDRFAYLCKMIEKDL
jgi:predicted transcriptional regulator